MADADQQELEACRLWKMQIEHVALGRV